MNQLSTSVLDRQIAAPKVKGEKARRSRRIWRPSRANFIICVVLPGLVVGLYFSIVAAPIFVSEAQFVVRMAAPPSSNAFTSYLQTTGIARSQDDTASVQEFLQSRAALSTIEAHLPVRALYGSAAADGLARFPRLWDTNSFEGLYRYYRDRTEVVHNDTTGIVTLKTTGFRAQDVYDINHALLQAGGDLLKRMNDRARSDAVTFSVLEVKKAEERLLQAQGDITAFRTKQLLIDPSRTSTKILELVARLSSDLATTRARRAELQASAPESTSLPFMANRIDALQEQIDDERAKVVGSNAALAPRIAEYERLTLTRDFADKALIAASNALDGARADARRQQLYLEVIVAPNLPDEAGLPTRARDILIAVLALLASYFIFWLAIFAVRDHLQTHD